MINTHLRSLLLREINTSTMHVILVLYTLSVVVSGASIHHKETETPGNIIDGIDEFKIPEEYMDIAMMCDLFKKLNGFSTSFDSESLKTGIDETYTDNKINNLSGDDEPDSDDFAEMLEEMETDKGESKESSSDDPDIEVEQTVRKERVRRSNSDSFPKELLDVLQGVCRTDECLQILREFYEWRQNNGYPVYTGVSQIG